MGLVFSQALAVALTAAPAVTWVAATDSLQQAVTMAKPGDTIRVKGGRHTGTLAITVPDLTVEGLNFPTLDGEGRGPVVMVLAPRVTLKGLHLTRSGTSPYGDDAGVVVLNAPQATIMGNRIDRVYHGVVLRRSPQGLIQNNQVAGEAPQGQIEAWGDGIRIWSSTDTRVAGNHVQGFRDGIYLEFAHRSQVAHNRVTLNRRYGLHFMYMDDSRYTDNSFTGNQAGSVLMYSKRITVARNTFADNRGSVGQGLLFRDNNDSQVVDNRIVNNTVGLFMDGANRNRFSGNLFGGNGWGILLFSSSADNVFTRNTFFGNHYEVAVDMKRSRNRFHDAGQGNFWSHYKGYDLNGDGQGDVPHRPVSVFAFLAMQFPDLYAFSGSPAVKALEFAQRLVPAMAPSDLVDEAPLMKPEVRRDRD